MNIKERKERSKADTEGNIKREENIIQRRRRKEGKKQAEKQRGDPPYLIADHYVVHVSRSPCFFNLTNSHRDGQARQIYSSSLAAIPYCFILRYE